MIGKTPSFWYRQEKSGAPLAEKILTPLSWIYRAGHEWHRHSKTPEVFSVPVLCVGNINAGGTGKTPVAIALMQRIKSLGVASQPFFLTRGHGGGERGPLMVDKARHTSWDVGDEPLLLVQEAPTIVATDRAKGAQLAINRGADLIVMDDGLQNPGIAKDIQCVVISGEMGFGNCKLLPAGPLREPVARRLAQADFFVITGQDHRNIRKLLPAGKPVLQAMQAADTTHTHLRYVAFAGLGYPEKFFDFLKDDLRLNIIETFSYPDHYPYAAQDIEKLKTMAAQHDAKLITTPKDLMRLPDKMNDLLETVHTRITWNDETLLDSIVHGFATRKK
ncbi:MAG: tetraacyldisaccharide 4'-kinase [Alphaproteobacteria bacterium]